MTGYSLDVLQAIQAGRARDSAGDLLAALSTLVACVVTRIPEGDRWCSICGGRGDADDRLPMAHKEFCAVLPAERVLATVLMEDA